MSQTFDKKNIEITIQKENIIDEKIKEEKIIVKSNKIQNINFVNVSELPVNELIHYLHR